jgi:hypothetical protein
MSENSHQQLHKRSNQTTPGGGGAVRIFSTAEFKYWTEADFTHQDHQSQTSLKTTVLS